MVFLGASETYWPSLSHYKHPFLVLAGLVRKDERRRASRRSRGVTAAVGAALAVVIYKRDDVGEYVNHEYEHLQNRIHDLEKQLQHSKKA